MDVCKTLQNRKINSERMTNLFCNEEETHANNVFGSLTIVFVTKNNIFGPTRPKAIAGGPTKYIDYVTKVIYFSRKSYRS